MSVRVITCEKCGAWANIEVMEHAKPEYCDCCHQSTKTTNERMWLCYECALKWLTEKIEKNPKLPEAFSKQMEAKT